MVDDIEDILKISPLKFTPRGRGHHLVACSYKTRGLEKNRQNDIDEYSIYIQYICILRWEKMADTMKTPSQSRSSLASTAANCYRTILEVGAHEIKPTQGYK